MPSRSGKASTKARPKRYNAAGSPDFSSSSISRTSARSPPATMQPVSKATSISPASTRTRCATRRMSVAKNGCSGRPPVTRAISAAVCSSSSAGSGSGAPSDTSISPRSKAPPAKVPSHLNAMV